MRSNVWLVFLITAMVSYQSPATDQDGNIAAINSVLDDLHDAAAKADKVRYLGHFAPNAVFMGTDDRERWPLSTFSDYVAERFKGGKGWSYKAAERHVHINDDGKTAWFDEVPVSQKWGRFRGTGVLLKISGEWKVAHYSFSFLVPNEVWAETSELVKKGYQLRAGESAAPH